MSQQLEPDKARKVGGGKKPPREDLVPRILVPTPAQLAAGVRVVDADPDTWPAQVGLAVKRAEKAGWSWRVSYSHFLAVPPTGGADAGQWVDTHSMVVRLSREWVGRAWGAWHGTERLGWKFDSAQFWGAFMPRQIKVGADALAGLIVGTMNVVLDQGTGVYRVEKVSKP